MKRTLVTTIALSLAALAITAAAPIAVAAPGSAPMPAAVITTVIEQEGFTVDVTSPATASASLTLTIHGTRNARVEAFAGRNIDAVHETYTVGETEPDGTLVLRLLAPAEGWRPGTVYQWKALGTELGADAYAWGTFTTPSWTTPTEPPVTNTEEDAITAAVQAPASRHGSVVITVKGAEGGDQIEAGVERTKPGGDALIALATGSPDERPDVLVIPAPNEGWGARTQYTWWVNIIADRDFSHRGHFTTPAWTEAGEPTESRFRTEIQLPKTRTAPLVVTVTGAEPGVGVNVSLGRSVKEQADGLERVVSDANGRAVITIKPGEGGWRSGARYYWFVWAEYENAGNDEVLRQLGGSLTMPTWTRDGGVEQPGTVTKPKERTGGMSKTGV